MNKVNLDILCAFAISIVANIKTPYLQKIAHPRLRSYSKEKRANSHFKSIGPTANR
jgi:hypothetical protein